MKLKFSIFGSVLAVFVGALLFSGCVSTSFDDGQSAYVYVAENHAITFWDETFLAAAELPERLLAAGAVPATRVVIIPQGDVPRQFLLNLVAICGHKGLPNVVIRQQYKASAVISKPGEKKAQRQPISAKPPKVSRSREPKKMGTIVEPVSFR